MGLLTDYPCVFTPKSRGLTIAAVLVAFNVAVIASWGMWMYPRLFGANVNTQNKNSMDVTDSTQAAANRVPGALAAELLMAKLEPMDPLDSRWERVSTDSAPLANPLDFACGPSISLAAPAFTSQEVRRSKNASILYQVRVYPAGIGGLAMSQMREAARCVGGYLQPITTIGVEAFGFYKGTNSLVVFRYGDVLGVTAWTRNAQLNLSTVGAWATQWPAVLTGVCRSFEGPASEALRNPIRPDYKGYTLSQALQLDEATRASYSMSAESNVRAAWSGRIQPTKGAPALPLSKPQPALQVDPAPVIPAGLVISLPTQPTMPVAPVAPKAMPVIETAQTLIEDPVGPGCGWDFTGQKAPAFDQTASTATDQRVLAESLERLKVNYAEWITSAWRYAWEYSLYEEQVATWQTWVANANAKINEAAWIAYDAALLVYQQNLTNYQTAKSVWDSCNAGQSTPLATCGPEPVAPMAPTEPSEPRPGSTPTPTPTPTVTSSPTATPSSSPTPLPSSTSSPTSTVGVIKP